MKKIKNIIFDLGVVLVNLNRQACIDAFSRLGIADVDKLTSVSGHTGIFGEYEKGELTTAEFYSQIRTIAQKEISDKQIHDAWVKMVTDLPEYKLETLLLLREKYRIFLLSNTNEIHWNWCAQHMFNYKNFTADDFFEKRWLSNEIHLLKPSKDIFSYVLKDGDLNPEETLFLDDAEANCEMAAAFGIRSYQPNPGEDWTFLFKS